MKLAFVATEKLPVPAIRGGAIQIYLQSIAPLLAKTIEVTVFSIQDSALPATEEKDGVRYIRLNGSHFAESVTEKLKKERFDVIHVCNRPTWISRFHSVSQGSRFVLSVHNEMFAPEKLSREEGERCLSLVYRIVTVSDYIAETIQKRFPEAKKKLTTVYSGVSLDRFHPSWTEKGKQIRTAMRRRLQLEGKKVVLFVGRLSKVKGPHILLQALPALIEKHPDIVLLFVGSKWFGANEVNPYVKYLYTLGALYPDNVVFIKFVPPDDIHRLYAASDLFVCASQWQEPLARVHYEAMAAGLPVVTTNRGGNGEVVNDGENGRVIDDYRNPEAFVQAICEILADRAVQKRFGENGRRFAEKHYGWENVARNLQNVYERAIKEGENHEP